MTPVYHVFRNTAALLVLCLIPLASWAQDDLQIRGLVKDDETLKKMAGVTVIVLQNGTQFDAVQTNGGGKYEFSLPLGYQYDIRFTQNGSVSKTVRMNTVGIPEEDQAGGFQLDLDMTLFTMIEGFDTSITDEPIGKAGFDPQKNSIEFDFGYTAERQRMIEDERKRLKDLAENMEKMQKKFDELIQKGDGKMDTEKFEDALGYYNEALGIFPQDEGAIAKRDAAQAKIDALNAAAALDAQYEALVTQGNGQMKGKEWGKAIDSYKEAIELKPSEKYPKDQIAEAEKQKALAADQEQYDALIDEADKLFNSEDYALAIDKYKAARDVMPSEKYPSDQIAEAQNRLDALLADAAKLEEMQRRYDDLMDLGNKNFKKEDYQVALRNFQDAWAIFPDEREPQDRIEEIQDILDALAAQDAADAEANAADAERARIEAEYNALITSADEKFDKEQLVAAKADYQAALELKENEKYPKSRIKRIDDLLARMAEDLVADQQRQDEEDARLAAEEEARIAAEERERMAEEERQRRMDEERAERIREEEERRRQEEEERLRRERMLSNIDRSKEDEVDEYFRNAKEKEEESRRKRVQDKKEGVQDLYAMGADRSTDARTEQARQRDAKVTTMEEIYRQGGYDLDDRQRTSAQEVEAAGTFVVEESEESRQTRSRREMDIQAQVDYTENQLDKSGQRKTNLATFERKTTEQEEVAQRHLDRSQTLRRDKGYDTRQEKESDQRVQNDGRGLQERKADDRERTKEEVDRFQQDVSSAAEERRTTAAEDKNYAKEQAETIANEKSDLTIEAQVRVQKQKSANDNFMSDRALEAQRRSYERQRELHGKDSGSPKDQDDLLPKDGTDDLPEGVSEKSYELGNKIVIERTVKVGNKVDVYKKVVSKAGTYYFKNDQSITEQAWKEETLDVRD